MDLKPVNYEKIERLTKKGVYIPNPLSIHIGDEVNIECISGKGVSIYPGCRLYGPTTVISAGAKIGYEGPVTIDDCQIGPGVELKGGYFNKSVFLENSKIGSGAHVREGTILEEEASGAHSVGLKHTILFPFVTLGSLINFCDCLMAGGTSRKNHSEVGSSYIHFNYTPQGDKSTASLIGDVPRGVMLDQNPIFLGGQGGIVGPLRIGYGNVIAAGCILREDCIENNKLIIPAALNEIKKDFHTGNYGNIRRILLNNVLYIANLSALEQWYTHIRKLFFKHQEFGLLLYNGSIEKLVMAKKERLTRMKTMADNLTDTSAEKSILKDDIETVCALLMKNADDDKSAQQREKFVAAVKESINAEDGYLSTILGMNSEIKILGSQWLQMTVDSLLSKTGIGSEYIQREKL